MAFPLVWLPLMFAGADPKVIVTGDHERVERALSDGVRVRVAAGWDVLDLRTVNDEYVVTVGKGDAFEKHIIHFDTKQTYRIEKAASAPTNPEAPSEFFLRALAAPRGGLQVVASCGGYYDRAYIIDDEASGEFATSLVARTFATADDVGSAWSRTGHVVFAVQKRSVQRDLFVWLDPKGNVLEAQLRRFEHGGGGATYKQTADLKRATSKTRVMSIIDTAGSFRLVTPKGKFVIEQSAFDYGDHEGEGCGC